MSEELTKLPVKLARKLERRISNAAQIKALEAEQKDISDEIAAYMLTNDLKRAVGTNGVRVTYCNGKSTRIDKKRLLSLGVAPTTIAQATVSTPYTYIQAQVPKEDS